MNLEGVKCNLCKNDRTSFWGRKAGLDVFRCNVCGLVYVNPRPTLDELKKHYSIEYFEEGDYASNPERRRMYLIEIKTQIARMVGERGRFLDVGCAFGAFLNLLPETFEKYGLEFSESAAAYGRQKYGLNIQAGGLGSAAYPDGFFDVVHLRGVIEHLQDPANDMAAAHRLLKPGGHLVISTTPNIASPAARFFRERFRLVMPMEHIYYFSPRTLRALLEKSGFAVGKIFYPYLNTPYRRLGADIRDFILNRIKGKDSPPFFYSVMTVYAVKK